VQAKKQWLRKPLKQAQQQKLKRLRLDRLPALIQRASRTGVRFVFLNTVARCYPA